MSERSIQLTFSMVLMSCYSLAYALDGGEAGEAPVFVPPPRPIGEDLDGLDDGRGFLGLLFSLC
jgi:hypothetical protein